MSPEEWSVLIEVSQWMLGVAAICFVLGEITRNVSQVDKLWSIIPVVWCWFITARFGFESRMVLMASLATIWGVRLTYNFSRQGGYSWKFWTGHEDYRWAHVRKWPVLNTTLGFALFDLVFIALYQNVLLLLIVLPILTTHGARAPLGSIDVLLAIAFVGLVVLETLADQEQWNFQNEKKRLRAEGRALEGRFAGGFIRDGLFARSRHPNYFAEQAIWVVFYLFTVAANRRFDWTGIGCVLLILLFQGSSRLSESIQADKYPEYLDYQSKVSRFLPRVF